MSLSKTLVGGVIGALVGVIAHVGFEATTAVEAPWFGVFIGVLTGLGVRRADTSVQFHASYARGALTALIAIVAIVASSFLLPMALRALGGPRAVAAPNRAALAPAPEPAEGIEPGEAVELPPRGEAILAVDRPTTTIQRHDFSVWQFVAIAIGMFLAYEMGRGANPPPEEDEEADQPSESADATEPAAV